MSSALTGNKIKDSYQALLKIGTNGSLDPITPISISDGLGNDTPILLSRNEFKTQVVSTAKFYGFWADVSSNSHVALGDYAGQYNGTQLYVNDSARLIQTYGGANKGFKLDFNSKTYSFGDFDNVNFNSALIISDLNNYPLVEIYADANLLSLSGSNNTILGVSTAYFYNDDPNANSNNYAFGSNWLMENDDSVSYPFKYNTVLNCYNSSLNTINKSMQYNLFANIQDPSFTLQWNPNNQDKEAITNCFMFGLTNLNGSNTFNIFTPDINKTNTNVVILNGSGLSYGEKVTNIFSVNASLVNLNNDTNGITILGGDYFSNLNSTFVAAQHITAKDGITGVNVFGQKAKLLNNFTNVFGYYNENSATSQGQVQIEQKQLYRYYADPDVAQNLLDTFDDYRIYIPIGSLYLVEVKIISYIGDNDFSTGGNWYKYDTFMVSNSVSNIVKVSPIKNVSSHNVSQVTVNYFDDADSFGISVRPNIGGFFPCWVKAEVVINKISVV
jgi:hypothetical protein